MKDTITVRKEHYDYLKNEFKAFAVAHKVQGLIGEGIETYQLSVEFETLQQFYAAVLLSGMTQAYDKGEEFLKGKFQPKPFTENELTQS